MIPDALADPNCVPNKKAESKVTDRYTNGFRDIVQKHFLNNLEGPSVQRVITMISHSDGINAWLDLFAPGKKAEFNDYSYCCTLAVELQARRDTDGQIKVERQPLHIVHNQ